MEGSKKKTVMIGIIVLCAVSALAVWVMSSGGTGGGVEDLKRGEMMWVICLNPQCKATYEVDRKDYYDFMQNYTGPRGEGVTPMMTCQKCSKPSIIKAVKCKKCGLIFREGTVPNDFTDRCPQCKYSDVEELRK